MNLGGVRMADKVILTKEQANSIEKWINKEQLIIAKASGFLEHGVDEPIAELTMKQLVKAIYIGYEVEPDFKVGDWVVNTSNGYIKLIENEREAREANFLNNDYIKRHELRHATSEEIAEEKERRFWNKFGREVNEYRAGDIVKGRGVITEKWRLGPVKKTPELEGAVQIEDISDGNTIDLEMESCRLICPVEQRLDWEGE